MKRLSKVIVVIMASIFLINCISVCVSSARYSLGDVNLDRNITSADVLCLLRVIKGVDDVFEHNIAADINKDGKVTASDLLDLKMIIKGVYVEKQSSVTIYSIEHYEDFLPYINSLSFDYLNKESKMEFWVTDGTIYSKTYENGEEIVKSSETEIYDKYNGIVKNKSFIKFASNVNNIKETLKDNGISNASDIDNWYVIEVNSWIPTAIVVEVGEEHYFIEVMQEFVYDGYFNSEYINHYTVYNYREYFEKYNGTEYVTINVCGNEIKSKYAVIDSFMPDEESIVPFFTIMNALGYEENWNSEHTKAEIIIYDTLYTIGFDESAEKWPYVLHSDKNDYLIPPPGSMVYKYFTGEELLLSIFAFDILEDIGYSITVIPDSNSIVIEPIMNQ